MCQKNKVGLLLAHRLLKQDSECGGTEDGSYTVVVTDKAGNVSETSFAIDKTVDFKVNVNNGGLANSVTVTVDATAPTLTLGGVENGGTTTEGVIISDVSEGNVKVFLVDLLDLTEDEKFRPPWK